MKCFERRKEVQALIYKNGVFDRFDFICNGFIGIMQIDIIFKIAAIGILITVITQVLKKSDRDDIATLVTLAGFIIVLTFVLNMIGDLFETVKNIFNLY